MAYYYYYYYYYYYHHQKLFLDWPWLKLRNLLQSVVIIICMVVLLLETLLHRRTLKEAWPELAVAARVLA